MTELDTMYRLIILYMLDKVEHPLTNTQITNFILEKDYTTYFTVQQILSDLLSSGFITAESTHNNTRYRITGEGRQTLSFFSDKISPAIKEDVLNYFREHGYELKCESSVFADYFKAAGSGYGVRCRINESEKSVVDLTLTVETRAQAEAICRNWNSQSSDVYALLMDMLLK